MNKNSKAKRKLETKVKKKKRKKLQCHLSNKFNTQVDLNISPQRSLLNIEFVDRLLGLPISIAIKQLMATRGCYVHKVKWQNQFTK